MGDEILDNIYELLKIIELKMKHNNPETLIEALNNELKNEYIWNSLKIIKGKLLNELDESDIKKIISLKRYFEIAEANKDRIDDEVDIEFLKENYNQ